MTTSPPILLVACGNPLMGDDALGPHVARALAPRAPPHLQILDLATAPAALLDHLPNRTALLIVDAASPLDCPLSSVQCPVAPNPCLQSAIGHGPSATSPPSPTAQLLDLDFFDPHRPALASDQTLSTHSLSITSQLQLAQTLRLLPPRVRLLALTITPLPTRPQAASQPAPLSPALAAQLPALIERILHWTAVFAG